MKSIESRENREHSIKTKDPFIRERDKAFESEPSKERHGKSDFDFEMCSRVPTWNPKPKLWFMTKARDMGKWKS